VGFILLPYLIQSNFTKVIEQNLNTQGYINRVYINPYTFEVKLHKLNIRDDKNQNLLYFNSLYLDIEFTQLFSSEIVVKNLLIDQLKTSVSLYKDKTLNFSHILKQLSQKEEDTQTIEKETKEPLLFTLEKFSLKDARFVFQDDSKSTPFLLKTKPFDFEITNFSTKKESIATLKTDIDMVDTLNLHLTSEIVLNPMSINGDMTLQNIQLAKIYSYIKDDVKFQFDGIIDKIKTNYAIKIKDQDTFVNLKDTFIDIPNVHYRDTLADLIITKLNHTIDTIKIVKNQELKYDIETVQLTSKNIQFVDVNKDKEKKFNFKELAIDVDKFSSDTNSSSNIALSLSTPSKGLIKANTKASIEPLNVISNLHIKDLTITPYKEYIKDFINLDIKSTDINTKATIKLADTIQDVKANITLSDVDISHDITKKRLLKLKTLAVQNLKYTNNNLVIDNVSLDDFITSVKIAKDKSTNIDNLTKKDTKENNNTTVKTQKDTFKYYIKTIQITNGKASFSDHSLPLDFDTNIHSLKAQINDLSSENKETKIKLNGIVEKYGLANINATTLLANFKEKTDVNVAFENLDVRSFSPYSGKFIGQKIADGRLWLNLNYHIKDAQLSSTNNVKLKDLTLGEDVNSSEAMSLPIGLAIALLEDSEGLIEVDIPVKGDMSNPQFELGGVIWKTIGNVLTNIITAPFRFLGSLLGGDEDEELGLVDFKFGESTILAPQKEKLDKLIGLLEKKKNLIVAIEPAYNKSLDTQKLIDIKYEKLISSINKKKTLTSLFITKFGKEKFEKIQTETPKEKIDAILSSQLKKSLVITQKELENLATKRATNLQAYFVSHKLILDRIQIKKEFFVNEENDTKELSLKLELNVKE